MVDVVFFDEIWVRALEIGIIGRDVITGAKDGSGTGTGGVLPLSFSEQTIAVGGAIPGHGSAINLIDRS